MSEEKQEIEINIVGAFAVITNKGFWLGVFPTALEADKFKIWHTLGKFCQIRPITRKIDFMDASKIEVGGGAVKEDEKSFVISPKLTETLKELEKRGHA